MSGEKKIFFLFFSSWMVKWKICKLCQSEINQNPVDFHPSQVWSYNICTSLKYYSRTIFLKIEWKLYSIYICNTSACQCQKIKCQNSTTWSFSSQVPGEIPVLENFYRPKFLGQFLSEFLESNKLIIFRDVLKTKSPM